jgi:hypothetical protein
MIAFLGYLLVMAVVLALWEIQIEGKNGWAGNLPCWRIEKGWLVKLWGGRPFTGYHFFLNFFMLLFVHMPLFFTVWNLRLESLLLGFFVGIWLIEDFLWFVLNPNYGLKNFRKEKIWWHKIWWGPVPSCYWWGLAMAGTLIYLGRTAI